MRYKFLRPVTNTDLLSLLFFLLSFLTFLQSSPVLQRVPSPSFFHFLDNFLHYSLSPSHIHTHALPIRSCSSCPLPSFLTSFSIIPIALHFPLHSPESPSLIFSLIRSFILSLLHILLHLLLSFHPLLISPFPPSLLSKRGTSGARGEGMREKDEKGNRK